jgi:hypothetical protein
MASRVMQNSNARKIQKMRTMEGEENEQVSLVDALPYFDTLPDG